MYLSTIWVRRYQFSILTNHPKRSLLAEKVFSRRESLLLAHGSYRNEWVPIQDMCGSMGNQPFGPKYVDFGLSDIFFVCTCCVARQLNHSLKS